MSLQGKSLEILSGENNFLGKGFYGTVLKARWGNKLCAIKKLRSSTKYSSVQINADTIQNNNELEDLKTLVCHENIVRIDDVYVERNKCYLVMEYVDGITFYNYLHNKRGLTMDLCRHQNLILQLAKGIDHLHSNKIVHRNLSTRCLLLSHKYSMLKICMDLTYTSGFPISIYTAPEVLRLHNYNMTSDVYSFGIIFWEIFARQIPFASNLDEDTIIYLTLKGIRPNLELLKVKPNRSFFQKLIKLCWDADGEKRPSMKVLADWLSFSWKDVVANEG